MASKPELLTPEPPGKIYPGVKLDVLRRVLDEIDADPELQAIFGTPVSSKLAFIDREGVLKVVEAGELPLNPQQKKTISNRVQAIIDKHKRGGLR